MTLETVLSFLLSSVLINYAILLAWFVIFRFAHDWMFQLHGKWFRLTAESFDTIHYGAMAFFKVGILLLNLVPYVALSIVTGR